MSPIVPPPGSFVAFPKSQTEQSIPKRFEDQVGLHPQRLAIKSTRHQLTYEELNDRANRVAHAVLAQFGDSTEPIALLVEQGVSVITAVVGILKAGKSYVALDPAYPDKRLDAMLQDAQPGGMVTDNPHVFRAQALATRSGQVLNIDTIHASAAPANPSLTIPPDHLAYIFYTSGSTGRPKGVMDTHRNVLHNIMRYTNSLAISSTDRLTLLQSCSFSGSVSSLFSALLNGAAVFPFELHAHEPRRLAAWMRQESITMYHSVPSIFRLVATAGGPFPALRVIRLEGDQATPHDIRLYQQHFPSTCHLVNGLGATECGIVRQYVVSRETPVPRNHVPIGYAVEDMEIHLLDASGHAVENGEAGEIAVQSAYLAQGYWRQPQLTAAAFREDPQEPGVRLYRMGDLGRMQPDSCLEHLGRQDWQPKIRGHRVNLVDIEATLVEHPLVQEAVVITHAEGQQEPRLIAYLVPDDPSRLTLASLRRHIAAQLPGYMCPALYIMLQTIPLDTNGKVNRRKLPVPSRQRPVLDNAYVEPRTPYEEQLAAIWMELLQIDDIGVHDHFLDLGGDSLLAMQLVSRILETLRVEMSLRTLLEAPTVADMAVRIVQQQAEMLDPDMLQRWLSEQDNPESPICPI